MIDPPIGQTAEVSSSSDLTYTPDEKRCFHCQKTRPRSMFYRRLKSPDGLAPSCKECQDQKPRVNKAAKILATGLKKCICCQKEVPIDQIVRDTKRVCDLGSYCKQCLADKALARSGKTRRRPYRPHRRFNGRISADKYAQLKAEHRQSKANCQPACQTDASCQDTNSLQTKDLQDLGANLCQSLPTQNTDLTD